MITTSILQRVLQIKIDDSTGSSFTIEVDDQQYLITAKHIFKDAGYPSKYVVEIFNDSKWKNLVPDIHYSTNDEVDIAVLSFAKDKFLTPTHDVICATKETAISEDCYFLGFPYGLKTEFKGDNNGYPIPFVKKASISSVRWVDDVSVFYLDGMNNVGFSGGPAVRITENKKIQIIGVVCSYKPNYTNVYDSKGNKVYIGAENNYLVTYDNSGIIHVHGINHALEIIENI